MDTITSNRILDIPTQAHLAHILELHLQLNTNRLDMEVDRNRRNTLSSNIQATIKSRSQVTIRSPLSTNRAMILPPRISSLLILHILSRQRHHSKVHRIRTTNHKPNMVNPRATDRVNHPTEAVNMAVHRLEAHHQASMDNNRLTLHKGHRVGTEDNREDSTKDRRQVHTNWVAKTIHHLINNNMAAEDSMEDRHQVGIQALMLILNNTISNPVGKDHLGDVWGMYGL